MARPPLTEAESAAIRVPFLELFDRQARERPEKEFIRCIDTGRSVNFATARDVANRIAAWLKARGIGANDRIAVIGGNSLEYVLLYLSILRHGATLCALGAETVGASLGDILRAVSPKIVLVQSDLDLPAVRTLEGGSVLPYATWPASRKAADEFFAQIEACPSSPAAPPVGGPDDLATITYTSGSTGRPKGIAHHYSAVLANTIGTIRALEIGPDDRILEFRSFGWLSARVRLTMALHTGATLVIAHRFSQSRFFDWIRSHDVTIATAVPTVISMLVNRPIDVKRADLPKLRFLTSSAAPLAVEHERAFEAMYGIEIRQLYGISESGGVTCNPPGRRKTGSAGTPSLYQDVEIVDADGRKLPPGEIGEIDIGGEQVVTGYLEYDGSITVLRGKRLRTGDLGYLDTDGYLFVTGRRSETINRGGAKVSPVEVDNILLAHADVAEAATIGVPDPVFGEEIVSFVVARGARPPEIEALMRHCARYLPEYKRPRRIEFIAQMPKSARGKIDRLGLLERWKQGNRPA